MGQHCIGSPRQSGASRRGTQLSGLCQPSMSRAHSQPFVPHQQASSPRQRHLLQTSASPSISAPGLPFAAEAALDGTQAFAAGKHCHAARLLHVPSADVLASLPQMEGFADASMKLASHAMDRRPADVDADVPLPLERSKTAPAASLCTRASSLQQQHTQAEGQAPMMRSMTLPSEKEADSLDWLNQLLQEDGSSNEGASAQSPHVAIEVGAETHDNAQRCLSPFLLGQDDPMFDQDADLDEQLFGDHGILFPSFQQ